MHRGYDQRNVSAPLTTLFSYSSELLDKSFLWRDSDVSHLLQSEILWLPCLSQGWPTAPISSYHVMIFTEAYFQFCVSGLHWSLKNNKGVPRNSLRSLSKSFPHSPHPLSIKQNHIIFCRNKKNILNHNLPDTLLNCFFRIHFFSSFIYLLYHDKFQIYILKHMILGEIIANCSLWFFIYLCIDSSKHPQKMSHRLPSKHVSLLFSLI